MVPPITSVRDRLWLLAHDERRNLRPCIDVRALAVGLTGATLIDLLLQDRIHVQQGLIHPRGRHNGPIGDPVCAALEHAIGSGRNRESHDPQLAPRLIDVLRDPSLRMYDRTVGMLIAAGILVDERRRRGAQYRLDPADINQWLRSQFIRALFRPVESDATLDSLCALVRALNLHSTLVLPYSTEEADALLRRITNRIPERTGPASPLAVIPHLATQVHHTIGDLATAAF